jgi:integrase
MEYGVRPGEARALQKDCLADGNVIIQRAFSDNELRETTKTGRIRVYKITAYFQKVLESTQPHLSPFVFVRDDGKPYTSSYPIIRHSLPPYPTLKSNYQLIFPQNYLKTRSHHSIGRIGFCMLRNEDFYTCFI